MTCVHLDYRRGSSLLNGYDTYKSEQNETVPDGGQAAGFSDESEDDTPPPRTRRIGPVADRPPCCGRPASFRPFAAREGGAVLPHALRPRHRMVVRLRTRSPARPDPTSSRRRPTRPREDDRGPAPA